MVVGKRLLRRGLFDSRGSPKQPPKCKVNREEFVHQAAASCSVKHLCRPHAREWHCQPLVGLAIRSRKVGTRHEQVQSSSQVIVLTYRWQIFPPKTWNWRIVEVLAARVGSVATQPNYRLTVRLHLAFADASGIPTLEPLWRGANP